MATEIFTVADACLISLSASVAAGCVPCAGYYVDRARAAGVSDDEVRAAIETAEGIRQGATQDVMTRVRQRAGIPRDVPAGPGPKLDPADRRVETTPRELLQVLAGVYAGNSHALLTRLLEVARERQVPPDQVAEAIQIARGVRNMAIAIVDRTAEREAGVAPEREEPPSCTCG